MELKTFIEQTLEEYRERLLKAVDGLTHEELTWRPGPEANHIGFILWHVFRVEDNWIQRFAQKKTEVWQRDGWPNRLNLPERDSGYEYTTEQVGDFNTPRLEDLLEYFASVRKETLDYIRNLDPQEFEVYPWPDRRPDFSIARMFRQVTGEVFQHLGHVAYLRGLQRGLNK